jgi:UDPglucose 6-dehydrogenase
LAELVRPRLRQGGRAAILGLSYKPNTNVVEESQGLELAAHLLSVGAGVTVFDPAAIENARKSLNGDVAFAGSMEEAVRRVDVVVITTPWDVFKTLTPAMLDLSRGRPAVVDCWRMLPRNRFEPAVEYLTLGCGAAGDRPA